jgi:hypothetical protein
MTEKLNSSDVAQGLDSANELIFGRTPQDLIVGLFGPIFVLIFLSILDLVGTYTFFILLILIIVNCVVLFRLAGPGTPVVEYLHGRLVQIRRPNQVSMFEVDEKSQSDAVPYPDGGEAVAVTDNSGSPIVTNCGRSLETSKKRSVSKRSSPKITSSNEPTERT